MLGGANLVDLTDDSCKKGSGDDETDDHYECLCRRSHAGPGRTGRGPKGRIRTRRMGDAAVRQRGRDGHDHAVPARGRVPVRPADLRDLRPLVGCHTRDERSPIGAALNSRPKYVVSTSITDPNWADTRVLSGDVAAAIGDLKVHQEGELLVPGSGELVRWLLANDFVDQLDLVTYPVVVGQGIRLFPDTGPDMALDLVTSRSTKNGVTIQTYRPTGRPQYVIATTQV